MKPLIRRTNAILGTLRAEYRQIYNRYIDTTERFHGNASQICEQIIDRLWEGDFYRTSLGHFDFFWMRDFGTVAESLVELGYQERVHHTLQWALGHYRHAGAVTLCIDASGHTFNAPAKRSIDALPWLLHSLVVSHYELTLEERGFLNNQLERYVKAFLDARTGTLRLGRYAEMRDAVNYHKSAYAYSLIARMAECSDQLGLTTFPFNVSLYQNELMSTYWNGDFFKADSITDVYSSDSALMPFFLHVIQDEAMVQKTFDYIDKAGLNTLYPLIYCQQPYVFQYRLGMGKRIMPNYTGTTIWTWHGTFYLHLLKRYNDQRYQREYKKFEALIERHQTYPELLNSDGSWYLAPFYRADPGMVWCALFLSL